MEEPHAPLYHLTFHNLTIESIPYFAKFGESERRAAKEIFDDKSSTVRPENISIDCCVISSQISAGRDTAFGKESVAVNGPPAIIMNYTAFNIRKGWFGKTRREIIAQRMRKVDPLDFGRLRASPEQYVDFAVSEAERLAKKHGLTINLSLYCHEAYVRKYMQK